MVSTVPPTSSRADAQQKNIGPSAQGRDVHLVGRLTPEVRAFLQPLLQTAAILQRHQLVLVADDVHAREALAALPTGTSVRFFRAACDGPVQQAELKQALRLVAANDRINAIYLHGVRAGLAAAKWVREQSGGVQVYLVPHSSLALQRSVLVRNLVTWWLRMQMVGVNVHTVINLAGEFATLGWLGTTPLAVLENPVDAQFFEVAPLRSRLPLVLVWGQDHQGGSDLMQRLAALVESTAQKDAAADAGGAVPGVPEAVGVVAATRADARQRAMQFGASWLFIAPSIGRGFPMYLAEAMAAGLACVALDAPNHRSLIDHGRTGFLASSTDDLLSYAQLLLTKPQQIQAVGSAARESMRQRVHPAGFHARAMQLLAQPKPSSPIKHPIRGAA